MAVHGTHRALASKWRVARLAAVLSNWALAATATALLCAVAWAQPEGHSAARREYTVLLESPSVGQRSRASSSSKRPVLQRRAASSFESLRRAVVRSQTPLLRAIAATGAEIHGSTTTVLNAVFVRATPEEADAVAAIPGIRAVNQSRRFRPMLDGVSGIVGAAAAKVRPNGRALLGDGVKIAIIDSGLDFSHEAFQDPSLSPLPGFPKGDPDYLHLTSAKVVAVRTYVDALNSGVPSSSTPDDTSPWDNSGHGTAVAMIALGRAVSAPHGEIEGIAPKARLGVYKVFGTRGLNFYANERAVIQAIDDAIRDGMDILNLSLGTDQFYRWDALGEACGGSTRVPCDAIGLATASAVHDFGRVVVAAAGNKARIGTSTSRSPGTVTTPGAVPAVIAVGSTGNAIARRVSVRVGGEMYPAASGTGPAADGAVEGPGVDVRQFGDPLGCEPLPSNALVGVVAVIERGTCYFVEKVEHADAAGAIAAVIVNHEGDDLLTMALLEQTDIPAFMVGASSGEAIRGSIGTPDTHLTLDPAAMVVDVPWKYVAASSSLGPSLALAPKPDLVAPGQDVLTASPRYSHEGVLFAPSAFREASGTSMAAPVVSGAAALVWEAFPDFDVDQVRSALVNSANPTALRPEGAEASSLALTGAGLLDLRSALNVRATAVPPSISFGRVGGRSASTRETLVIANPARTARTFRISVRSADQDDPPRVTINGASSARATIAGGRSIALSVQLSGRDALPGRHEGRIAIEDLAEQGGLTVPYMYAVSDGEPANILLFRGDTAAGVRGEPSSKHVLGRVTDQFGIPIEGAPVSFSVSEGDPEIERMSSATGEFGLFWALVRYNGKPDPQVVVARIGAIEIPFTYRAANERPRVESVVSAASDDVGPAIGGLATVRGSDFSEYSSGGPPSVAGHSLPIMRKGVTVSLDGANREFSVAGRIHSVDEGSVTLQVPWDAVGAEEALVKVRGDEVSTPFPVALQTAAPAIFNFASDAGPIALAMHEDGTVVSELAPVTAGTLVTLVMTGNGPVESPPATGRGPDRAVATTHFPEVWIADQPVTVAYSGLDPEAAGLYLLTIAVPAGVGPGLHRVRVEVNQSPSNEPLLPVR